MEQKELIDLLVKLRNMDTAKKFEDEISVWEAQIKANSGKSNDLIYQEFEQLAKRIQEETELE